MSKGLQALDSLYQSCNYGLDYTYDDATKDKYIIEKELKALEIIKRYIKLGGMGIDTSDCYFPYMSFEQKEGLSKEEYDLLKEVLS